LEISKHFTQQHQFWFGYRRGHQFLKTMRAALIDFLDLWSTHYSVMFGRDETLVWELLNPRLIGTHYFSLSFSKKEIKITHYRSEVASFETRDKMKYE
jgi:hypothetical protein